MWSVLTIIWMMRRTAVVIDRVKCWLLSVIHRPWYIKLHILASASHQMILGTSEEMPYIKACSSTTSGFNLLSTSFSNEKRTYFVVSYREKQKGYLFIWRIRRYCSKVCFQTMHPIDWLSHSYHKKVQEGSDIFTEEGFIVTSLNYNSVHLLLFTIISSMKVIMVRQSVYRSYRLTILPL